MRRHSWCELVIIGTAVTFLHACESPPEPTESEGIQAQGIELARTAGASATASGGGDFLVTIADGFVGEFSFANVQTDPSGDARGRFHYSIVFFGELVEFSGETTCMTVDTENNRVWIGGVITENNSTHPAWLTDVHEPGDDIWFRFVDNGEGRSQDDFDRTTFVGFEGNRGIITSEEYCEVQFWDEEVAPWAVTEGNIKLEVRRQ